MPPNYINIYISSCRRKMEPAGELSGWPSCRGRDNNVTCTLQDISVWHIFPRLIRVQCLSFYSTECEFTCSNSKCLHLESALCNGVNDCGDYSDETHNCGNLTLSLLFAETRFSQIWIVSWISYLNRSI